MKEPRGFAPHSFPLLGFTQTQYLPPGLLSFQEHILERKNRFGPISKVASLLKLFIVKVGFNQAEAADLDARRGHHTRAAFLRAAGLGAKLQAAFDAKLLTTWQQSARVQACFTQINDIAYSLNLTRKNEGVDAAAAELLARSSEILAAFKDFRAAILPDRGE